jgi:chloride channel protein, CIC family
LPSRTSATTGVQPLPGADGSQVSDKLGDFTTTLRVIPISLIATGIGVLGAFVALGLLRLIGLFTNLFFFGRWATALVSPANNKLGLFVVLVPVAGALIVGLMARYGSERIRGHGIPEAIEAILINGSRVEPRVAFLKPLSSAISIGSGGPFGAEGPIIMTGGAFGSMIAQFFHLTAAERKTLLVSGAAAGMSATFASPVAAVLLAVELLLFEWKPRSLVPVALASATAAAIRRYIIGLGPLFPTPPHPVFIGPKGLLGCLLAGVLAGVLSALLTISVYAAEDGFRKLPIHWMWWPAIGGLAIGLGGLAFPQALGVGYDTIGALLQGNVTWHIILGVLLVKWFIWSVSLGSGTSGGVLAPLLMMGGALGGLESMILPNEGTGFWPLISMGAILGGTMRSPFTGVIFAVELTHDVNVLLPLLLATTVAHGFTVLTLRRSILTEKVARRGYHLSREYAVDPLEILFVREVMRSKVAALPADMTLQALAQSIKTEHRRSQRLLPVVDKEHQLVGVLTRSDIQEALRSHAAESDALPIRKIARANPIEAYPDEPLRVVVYRMAEKGVTRLPVVSGNGSRELLGIVSLDDLLKARVRHREEERRRERVLPLSLAFARNGKSSPEN